MSEDRTKAESEYSTKSRSRHCLTRSENSAWSQWAVHQHIHDSYVMMETTQAVSFQCPWHLHIWIYTKTASLVHQAVASSLLPNNYHRNYHLTSQTNSLSESRSLKQIGSQLTRAKSTPLATLTLHIGRNRNGGFWPCANSPGSVTRSIFATR